MLQKNKNHENQITPKNKVIASLTDLENSYKKGDYLSVFIFYNNALNNKKTKAKTLLKAQMYVAKSYYNLKQFNESYLELNKIMQNKNFKNLSETDVVKVIALNAANIAKLKNKKQLIAPTNFKTAENVATILNNSYMPLVLADKPNKQTVENYFNFINHAKKQNKANYEHKIFSNVFLNIIAIDNILKHTQNENAVNLLEHYINTTTETHELSALYNTALKIYRQTNLNKFLEHYDNFAKLNEKYLKNLKQYHTESLHQNIKLSIDIDNLSKDYYNDELTNTLNLKALKKYEANIINNYGAIIYFDLNYLKTINDNHGHAVGDKYLKYFSSILLKIKKKHHPLIRVGGDEFVLICLNFNQDDAENFMKTLLQESQKPIDINDNSFKISYSAGIVLYNNPKVSLNKLIGRADKAMYKAKQEYRNNNYKFYKQ